MAACPVDVSPLSYSRRRPLTLTQRRLEANRRNAARSTGPRSANGKTRVARNAIKHGFFAAQERWTPAQQHDFQTLLAGLRDDFRPASIIEEDCVRTMAESYVRMASALRYENIAARKHHRERERDLEARIAAGDAPEGARLRAQRARLRRAGLWRPTIPDEREAMAITRYLGRIERTIYLAASQLGTLKNLGNGGASSSGKAQKQTHYSAMPNSHRQTLRIASEQRSDAIFVTENAQKQTHYSATPNNGPEALRRAFAQRFDHSTTSDDETESAKTNPLSSMFTGNRHQRRRAKALARRG